MQDRKTGIAICKTHMQGIPRGTVMSKRVNVVRKQYFEKLSQLHRFKIFPKT